MQSIKSKNNKFQRSSNYNAGRQRLRAKNQDLLPTMTQKPDHKVVVRHLSRFENMNYNPGGYFDGYEYIKPYYLLNNSSWSKLLEVYESMRVTNIQIRVWITDASHNTPGAIACNCYREIIPGVPNRYYEQLIVEPGSSSGRPTSVMKMRWRPIEPSDYEWYNHGQFIDMDAKVYGQINFAGVGFPAETKPSILIEWIINYDFKELTKPEAPPQYVDPRVLEYRDPQNQIDDDEEDYAVVRPRPKSANARLKKI